MTVLPTALIRPAYAAIPPDLAGRGCDLDALYLHVPFCSTKCHYCDFYSLAGHLDRAGAFLEALEREMRLQGEHFGTARPRTIFIGGGTPTLLPPAELARLLKLLHARFDLSLLEEFTVEANPNTFDAEKARVLADYGVNRVSFGAQSFHADELKTLQRDHDPASVPIAFETARRAGIENLNVDLIFGIPGQTLASWDSSLSQALALEPSHMSCYSLTYEPNTAMTARMYRGEFQRIDEDLELQLFDHVYHKLRAAGFVRYEISNYAARSTRFSVACSSPFRAPAEHAAQTCQHNLTYWKAGNWLGLGPSAGSHFAVPSAHASSAHAAHQWKNTASLTHYLEALSTDDPRLPISDMESLSHQKWSAAAAVFWLRLAEGLNFEEFRDRTGTDVKPALEKILRPFEEMNLVTLTPPSAQISEKGVAVSNHILSRVLAALEKK